MLSSSHITTSSGASVSREATLKGAVSLSACSSVGQACQLDAASSRISVGARTVLHSGAVLRCSTAQALQLGSDCIIGQQARLESCTVGDSCTVGPHCSLGAGSVLCSGSAVLSGSLLPGCALPPGALAVAGASGGAAVRVAQRSCSQGLPAGWGS